MKRLFYLSHRWLGAVFCLFMAMWFISGVVMMYVGYPKLTPAERLERLPSISASSLNIGLGQALEACGACGNIKGARITSVSAIPRYVFTLQDDVAVAVDGQTGQRIANVTAEEAERAVKTFSMAEITFYAGLAQEDAWTHSKALDPHRPLHVVEAITGGSSTLYYVSSRTGEVVRDATRTERIWNWAGAWIHWLYPVRGGFLDAQWRNIMITTSLLATMMALAGVITGVRRWRFSSRYPNGSRSPYRDILTRWHHLSGLTFGVVAFTWILSGMLSVNPWRVFDSGAKHDGMAYAGGVISAEKYPADISALLGRLTIGPKAPKELEWVVFDGKGYLVAFYNQRETMIISGAGDGPPFERFSFQALEEAGRRYLKGWTVVEKQELEEYDNYYYARAAHTMRGHFPMRLPVLRLKFNDSHSTWIHLDPYTGSVAGVMDSHKRWHRWLFAFLHSFDWVPLLKMRPAWDAALIFLSAGGLAISVTGAILGWRRYGRNGRHVLIPLR